MTWEPELEELRQRQALAREMGGPDKIARPVSYTHLRAHETVLDLVCRLLLEKKKNTQLTHTYTLRTATMTITKLTVFTFSPLTLP